MNDIYGNEYEYTGYGNMYRRIDDEQNDDTSALLTDGRIWLDDDGNAYDDEAHKRKIGKLADAAFYGDTPFVLFQPSYTQLKQRFTDTYTLEVAVGDKVMTFTNMVIGDGASDEPRHRHDYQLRIINYRVIAECSCGETMNEDEIREALR